MCSYLWLNFSVLIKLSFKLSLLKNKSNFIVLNKDIGLHWATGMSEIFGFTSGESCHWSLFIICTVFLYRHISFFFFLLLPSYFFWHPSYQHLTVHLTKTGFVGGDARAGNPAVCCQLYNKKVKNRLHFMTSYKGSN